MKKDKFATTNAVEKLDYKIELLRQEVKTGFAELESKMRAEFNKIVI